ncbi:helix-turn-helix domain-containing protein [Arenibacter certesii]|uniref:helix-turn-helix domain-containing protein n=1 Tax=Arenibacter certesii TaxID=228955 RepID=UPI00041A0C3B|nr:AraC family transcriptional regulator [Arenibacter certesii]
MTYILFIASFNAFFFLALLLQKRTKQLHDKILIFWLQSLGLATATYALSKVYFAPSAILYSAIIGTFLLHGPFLYLYTSALTLNEKYFKVKNLLHFAPFLVFMLYLFIANQFPEYSNRITIDHVSGDSTNPPVLFLLFLIITALSGPSYFLLAHRMFQIQMSSSFNVSAKEINMDWLKKLILVFGVVWTLLIVIAVIHHVFHLFTMDFCTNGLFLVLSVFIILIGYFGLKQTDVFVSIPVLEAKIATVDAEVKYAASKLEDDELQNCCNKVGLYMKSNRPYLDPDLTLPKLAQDLNVSTHHLSQVINEMHEKNFFNFINKYRVAEVKRKIQDPKYQNYSLLGIAYESGFNSKSAFNRVFKNVTGTTPSRFRDSISSS